MVNKEIVSELESPPQSYQPLKTSTPLRGSSSNYPSFSYFTLVTADEDTTGPGGEEQVASPIIGPSSILNTPIQKGSTIRGQSQGRRQPVELTPQKQGSTSIFVDREDRDAQFKTPENGVRGRLNGGKIQGRNSRRRGTSPFYCHIDLDSSSDEEEEPILKSRRDRSGRNLRPRNLFHSGVSIKKYDMFRENDSDSGNDKDNDEDVFFFLQSEEEDEELLDLDDVMEGQGQEKKRSSYSGIRGPKADAKALSLVTNCPVSVKWLVDNFEYCPGRSLPRGFVYDQYVLLCSENGLEPVNAASFGKLIRSVFPGLKTRRLGTRGNSKYHYNGVYLKPSSPLMVILNLIKTQQGLSYDGNGKRGRRVRRTFQGIQDRGADFFRSKDEEFMDCSPNEYLGKKPDASQPFAQLQINESVIPASLDPSVVHHFETIYFSHCQVLLSHLEKFELKQVFDEWRRFWRTKCNLPAEGEGVVKYRDVMSKSTLFKVCSLEATQQYVMSMDLSTYQFMIDILFPCMSKGMPVTMVNGMRYFIKDVEFVFYKMLDGYPKKLADVKSRCLRTFICMWNDCSRLNRMLKSAVSTIRNDDNIQAMHTELCRSINFQDIETALGRQKKTSETFLQKNLILEFRMNLDHEQNDKYNIKCWIHWAEQVAQKLIEERGRQVSEGECYEQMDPFSIWMESSDKILGAIAKGNTVTFGVFKGFLIWCDQLVKHVTKLTTARAEGFMYPMFYYESILEECDLKPVEPTVRYQTLLPPYRDSQKYTGEEEVLYHVNLEGVNQDDNNQEQEEGTCQEARTNHLHMVQDPFTDQVYYFDTGCLSSEQLTAFKETTNAVTGVIPTPIDALPENVIEVSENNQDSVPP